MNTPTFRLGLSQNRPTASAGLLRRFGAVIVVLLTTAVSSLFVTQARAAEWRKNTTVSGVAFEKVRVENDGKVIGFLAEAVKVRGRPCAKDWLHLHANGEVALFKLDQELELTGFSAPASTWVFQNEAGAVTCCAFPADIEIQGYLCRGSGGPKGVQVAFYESGRLKQFYLAKPMRIDGVLCDTGLIKGRVDLYENGHLKSCLLAEDLKQEKASFTKGERVSFDENGRAFVE